MQKIQRADYKVIHRLSTLQRVSAPTPTLFKSISILFYRSSIITPNVSYLKTCVRSLQSCLSLCDPHGPQRVRLPCPWDSLGKNTGVGYHALPQGIFLTQRQNPCHLCLLLCRQTHRVTWEAFISTILQYKIKIKLKKERCTKSARKIKNLLLKKKITS